MRVDPALAFMLLAGGIIGTCVGVWLFTLLRALGQLDITIGVVLRAAAERRRRLMVTESLRAIMRARQGKPVELRRPGSHAWFHGLPFKVRFKRSRIYVSAIPVWLIGFIIGFVGAVMGIGGGFLLVPMLIYFLRVPTATVIGTSMVLTLVTMASATVMHAATNHLVDAVLALILMVGGVIGAQFGARAGQQISGERLRLLLGLLVLAVGIRFALNLVLTPDDLYFDPAAGERPMRSRAGHCSRSCSFVALAVAASPRRPAERLIASISTIACMVTSSFTGDDSCCSADRADPTSRRGAAATTSIVTVTGPRQNSGDLPQGARARHLGQLPIRAFRERAVLSRRAANRPLDASPIAKRCAGCSSASTTSCCCSAPRHHRRLLADDPFRLAFLRLQGEAAALPGGRPTASPSSRRRCSAPRFRCRRRCRSATTRSTCGCSPTAR